MLRRCAISVLHSLESLRTVGEGPTLYLVDQTVDGFAQRVPCHTLVLRARLIIHFLEHLCQLERRDVCTTCTTTQVTLQHIAQQNLGVTMRCVSVTPRALSTSPSELLASPRELLASPSELSTSPRKLLASPSELSTSPSELLASPRELS